MKQLSVSKIILKSIGISAIVLLVVAFLNNFYSPIEFLADFFNLEEWQVGDIAVIGCAYLVILVVSFCIEITMANKKSNENGGHCVNKELVNINDSPTALSNSDGSSHRKPYTYLFIVVAVIIILVGGIYGAYRLINNSYNNGYSDGVKDSEETITEGIAKGNEPSGQIIYYTENGTVIHNLPNCQYLKNSDKVLNSPISSKSDWKHCSKCW